MDNTATASASRRGRRLALASGPAAAVIFVLVAVYVLASQNHFVGFEPGYNERQPKHHGWVSSHALAIISHATSENGFVGYALAYAEPDGTIRYDYFDRYPVFFSAGMHAILSVSDRLSSKAYIAKQVMNLIFLATMLTAYLIVDKLVQSKPAALAAALLAMSSEYLLFYKDMVHFDQPALLGMMILIYTIALYRIDGRRRAPYLGAVLAVSLGRGYASFAVLLTWLVTEWVMTLRQHGFSMRASLRALAMQPVTRVCVLSLGLGALMLSYNIGVESIRTGVAPLQTSIIQSAENRLGLDPAFNDRYEKVVSWGGFLTDQMDRLVRWSVPLRRPGGETPGNVLLLASALGVIAVQGARWDPERRLVVVLLAASGFVWMIGMRNMSGPHEYTTMYYIGLPLAFYAALFSLLKIPSRPAVAWALLLGALGFFFVANQRTQELHLELELRSDGLVRLSDYTWDMMRIREQLSGEGLHIHMVQGIPNAPYAMGFYLQEQYLSSLVDADYVIAWDSHLLPGNLTPENERLFLFRGPAWGQ